MKRTTLLVSAILMISTNLYSQDISVDEILENYFENIGGKENWMNLKGLKMKAKVNQGGLEIPLEIVQLSDGRQYTKFTVQGNDFYQNVYDGETLWSINFASLKPEKSDAEVKGNFELELNDFPNSFLNYKEKGYTLELIGTETIDGAETYKVKLTKEPQTIDGKEVEDVEFHYFDTEFFVPIAQDTEIRIGPQAGAIGRVTMSDFDEVEGLYFAFSRSQGIKDGPSQPMTIESYEVNPEIDDSIFKFPVADTGDN